jgi:hypothetical protein
MAALSEWRGRLARSKLDVLMESDGILVINLKEMFTDGSTMARELPGWGMAIGLLVLTAATHIDGWFGPLHSDASAWLYIAQQRDRGLVPYRDLWENKPPPIFVVNRLAWKSGNVRAVYYLFDVGLISLSAWFFWRVTRMILLPSGAATAACLYVVATAHPTLHYGAGITEAYALPLEVLAISLAVLYRWVGGGWRAWLSGVAWSGAIAFRMPAIVSLIAMLPLCLGRGDPERGGSRLGLCVGAVAGGVAGGMLAMLDPIVGGYFGDFLDVCVLWNMRYAAHETPSIGVNWNTALVRFADNISIWIGLHVAAWVGFLLVWRRRTRVDALDRLVWVTAACWYFADLLGTVPTLHQYPHHHYMTLGSLALGAAMCVDQLTRVCDRWGPLRFAPAVIAIAYAAAVWFVHIRTKLDENREVAGASEAAEFLRSFTRPNEPVLLWVWHGEAELFWRVDRPPPARHFMPATAFVYDPELALRTCEEILKSPPRFIADSSPYLSLLGMPADVIPTTRYESIRARYRDLYEPVARFANIAVYRRKDESRGGGD